MGEERGRERNQIQWEEEEGEKRKKPKEEREEKTIGGRKGKREKPNSIRDN
nr:MAG TPA: hypothetical protein [Caudoviricetes sp.]